MEAHGAVLLRRQIPRAAADLKIQVPTGQPPHTDGGHSVKQSRTNLTLAQHMPGLSKDCGVRSRRWPRAIGSRSQISKCNSAPHVFERPRNLARFVPAEARQVWPITGPEAARYSPAAPAPSLGQLDLHMHTQVPSEMQGGKSIHR